MFAEIRVRKERFIHIGMKVLSLVWLLPLLGVLAYPNAVNAEEQSAHEMSESSDNVWQFGLMIAGGLARVKGEHETETGRSVGAGFIVDRSLINNRLELGASVRVVGGNEGPTLGFDMFVEVPYHIAQLFEVYAGVGGTLAYSIDHTEVAAGPSMVAGFHAWINHHVGVGFEISYAYLFGSDNAHEVGILLGPIWEF